MKIVIGSDFHFEFYSKKLAEHIIDKWIFEPDTDLIIIAGDLHVGANKAIRTLKYIYDVHGIDIVYVPGNHEYYHSLFETENRKFREGIIHQKGYHILLSDHLNINGVKIFGCMGNIDGSYEEINIFTHGALNDFHTIADFEDHYVYGRRERKALNKAGSEDGIDIIITHTMPHPRCVSPKYKGDSFNACFTNDWSEEIIKYEPKFYICGHTHDNVDVIIHKTNILANPFGYPRESKDWKWNYIEI